MKKFTALTIVVWGIILLPSLFSQTKFKNKAVIRKDSSEFYENMKEEIKKFDERDIVKKKSFKVDFTEISFPTDKKLYKEYWHNEPINQGITGTCWSFSATSFFESEIYRLTNQKIKLSEMYTAYWEYIEKAKSFVRERGNSAFEEGSEANAVVRIWEKYGIVPAIDYSGKIPGQNQCRSLCGEDR